MAQFCSLTPSPTHSFTHPGFGVLPSPTGQGWSFMVLQGFLEGEELHLIIFKTTVCSRGQTVVTSTSCISVLRASAFKKRAQENTGTQCPKRTFSKNCSGNPQSFRLRRNCRLGKDEKETGTCCLILVSIPGALWEHTHAHNIYIYMYVYNL